jgi:hypothetical protein
LKIARTPAIRTASLAALAATIVIVASAGINRSLNSQRQPHSISFGDPTTRADFSFVAIPEPGALVSLIGGAAVLIGIQRFRRRS